ncbi:MAG: AAA family ATPase [Pirellulales bacterium]
MNIRLLTLTLQCKQSREVIPFVTHVSFFHGPIGAGKSSIARLVDFCLGGELERTTALTQELVSVALAARIRDQEVLFEREAHGSNQVQVTWTSPDGVSGSVLAPVQANPNNPIFDESIFNLSDLIFHLVGVVPIKVRRSKHDETSPMIRLSFRDVMWYCYLEQAHLDSTFFRLKEPFTSLKSRDVMRFVVGYYTERLQQLDERLEQTQTKRSTNLATADQIQRFLVQFGFGTEADVQAEISEVSADRDRAVQEQGRLREGVVPEAHPVDGLRNELRRLSQELGREEQVLLDLQNRVSEQEALRAELVSAKFKLARTEAASSVLSGVQFEMCPACGTRLPAESDREATVCYLCGRTPGPSEPQSLPAAEIVRKDLTARAEELADSLERARKAAKRQEHRIEHLRRNKLDLDDRLTTELHNYDSAFLAQSREVDRQVAVCGERLRNLERLRRMPEAIRELRDEADKLRGEEDRIRREIEEERGGLTTAEDIVTEIEKSFLAALLAVRLPGVSPDDTVTLNRKTWIPSILPRGDEALRWDFYNTGSGGKKTLLNVCYALAVHKVASERSLLPLPRFLIIDTPMKNIGEDVNRDVFVAFYQYLYGLARGALAGTQIIIIDKEYIASEPANVEVSERLMTPTDDQHPPLITYYRGP